ncbi:MAG TPA: 2-amino-4-hydroxy-6-hydroxymethyldihydropteridine diphosphokinase [Thermodesulfovibrionales bacterium]|nr:2-amino-4-hydroxy-6-hydroxymethyldihydropteridine diphosphokinase [Thermodesulfovibrionales bacterium]
MAIAYIGIGSNLGNRQKNCLRAIELLEKKDITVKKRSSMYETEPWGVKDQPQFINMALEVETELEPHELLKILKDVEREVGRGVTFKWGPRMIDLDILLFNDLFLREDNLQIPHPLMHERDFVLKPLCEIAPDRIHPLLKVSMCDLLKKLEKS